MRGTGLTRTEAEAVSLGQRDAKLGRGARRGLAGLDPLGQFVEMAPSLIELGRRLVRVSTGGPVELAHHLGDALPGRAKGMRNHSKGQAGIGEESVSKPVAELRPGENVPCREQVIELKC